MVSLPVPQHTQHSRGTTLLHWFTHVLQLPPPGRHGALMQASGQTCPFWQMQTVREHKLESQAQCVQDMLLKDTVTGALIPAVCSQGRARVKMSGSDSGSVSNSNGFASL